MILWRQGNLPLIFVFCMQFYFSYVGDAPIKCILPTMDCIDMQLYHNYNICMNGIIFEWDESKAKINLNKHKVSFEEASSVFYDENAILFDDPEQSDEEERFLLFGLSVKANMLIVCHCVRNNDTVIRVISARKATKSEAEDYEEINKGW